MTTNESNETPIFSFRLTSRDRANLVAIVDLDPDIPARNEGGARTEAVRAALREYAKKLRRRAERTAA